MRDRCRLGTSAHVLTAGQRGRGSSLLSTPEISRGVIAREPEPIAGLAWRHSSSLAVAEDLDDSARRRRPKRPVRTASFARRGVPRVLLDDNQLGMSLK